jgi:hypothetical protein
MFKYSKKIATEVNLFRESVCVRRNLGQAGKVGMKN